MTWIYIKTKQGWAWVKTNVKKTLIVVGLLGVASAAIINPSPTLNNQSPLITKIQRTEALGLNQTGMEILIRVGDKFSGVNKTKGWQDGQVIDIRPLGFDTSKLARKSFALIELPNIEYWTLRGNKTWKSNNISVMNLKKYLSVADTLGKQSWETGFKEDVKRKRDYFVDFKWLLDNNYITSQQYFDIYDPNKIHDRISLNFTNLDQIFKQENTSIRLARLEDTRIRTKARKLVQMITPKAQAITTGTYSICASGCDYATLQTFEAAIGTPLTGNLTAEHKDEETSISSPVVFDTDTATYLLKITAEAGAEHDGSAYGNGARITMGSYDRFVFNETTDGDLDDFEISKLALDTSGTSNFGIVLQDGGNSGSTLVNRMLIKGDVNSSDGIQVAVDAVDNLTISNNIVYGFTGTDKRGIFYSTPWAPYNINIYNNTVINNYDGINVGQSSGGTWNLKNNLVQGSNASGDGYQIAGSWTTSKNISEDATSPDGSPYVSLNAHDATSSFTDYANDDYRLVSGGTDNATIDDGVSLSGTFTDDVIGTTRSTWWIGAYELVAAAAGIAPQPPQLPPLWVY